eukprot:427081-Rhodomonas_salina.3
MSSRPCASGCRGAGWRGGQTRPVRPCPAPPPPGPRPALTSRAVEGQCEARKDSAESNEMHWQA